MIDFQQHEIKIVHVNVRTEVHGDDEVLAMDLKCETDLPNMSLDQLNTHLRRSLYMSGDDPDLLGPDAEHMPNLRYPQLGPLHWNGKVAPVSLLLHLGTKKNELRLANAKLDRLKIEAREGGTCGFVWRLQVHPNEDEAAKVMTVLKHLVKATLDVSQAEEEHEGDDDD